MYVTRYMWLVSWAAELIENYNKDHPTIEFAKKLVKEARAHNDARPQTLSRATTAEISMQSPSLPWSVTNEDSRVDQLW